MRSLGTWGCVSRLCLAAWPAEQLEDKGGQKASAVVNEISKLPHTGGRRKQRENTLQQDVKKDKGIEKIKLQKTSKYLVEK